MFPISTGSPLSSSPQTRPAPSLLPPPSTVTRKQNGGQGIKTMKPAYNETCVLLLFVVGQMFM